MLKWLREIDWAAIVGSALFLALCFLVLLPLAGYYPYAEQATNYQPDQQPSYRSLWAWLSQSNFWIAVFTGVLTFSTIGLWLVTWRAADAARDQFKLSREEFAATHRPEIVIHGVKYEPQLSSENDSLDKIGAIVFFHNKGRRPAKILSISWRILQRSTPLESDLPLEETEVRSESVASGMKDIIRCPSDLEIRTARMISGKTGRVFLIGRIVYGDDFGLRRETGFCRTLEMNHPRRWVRVEDEPEYEYQY